MRINIIGDIAGRYDELMLLLDKMPEADLVLSVGDMVDRGPKSRQVLEWFMNTENADALYGNHEDLFWNGIVNKNTWTWVMNGGGATLQSFRKEGEESNIDVEIPQEILDWVRTRPLYFETDDLFVSHAPVTTLKNLPDRFNKDDVGPWEGNFIWNRFEPKKPLDKFVVHGHNGKFKKHKWGDGSVFGMCLDNSHTGRLTGMHWPTKELFQQEFLDFEENKDYFHPDNSEIDS